MRHTTTFGRSIVVALTGGIVCYLLSFIGCSRWSVESTDGPLNAEGSQSPTFIRKRLHPLDYMNQRAWASRWGCKLALVSVANRIDSYCASLPEFSKWTALDAYIDGRQLRFAPAKFWIVSIDPIAVIMVPFAFTNFENYSLNEVGGAADERALVSSILANRYNFGTNIETASSIEWFVVGGNQGLATQRFNRDQLTLTNGDMVLVLTKGKEGTTSVTRAAK